MVDQRMEIFRSFAKGSYNNSLNISKSCKLGLDWTGPVVPGAVPQFSWSVVQAFLMYSFSSLALLSTALVASCPCRWGEYLVFELLIIFNSCNLGTEFPSSGIEILISGTID